MAIPLITNLPPAPSRLETEETFVPKADALLSQLPTFVEETNTSITGINNTADQVTADKATTGQYLLDAETARDAAISSSVYKGTWEGKTSAGVIGESYSYQGSYIYRLNVNLANISTSEPSPTNTNWQLINVVPFEAPCKPTFDLDFANQDFTIYDKLGGFVKRPLADLVSQGRATAGTSVDAIGGVTEFAAGENRFTFDGETGEALGYLSEESRTNLLTNSEFPNGLSDLAVASSAVSLSTMELGEGQVNAIAVGYTDVTDTFLFKGNFTPTAGVTYSLSVFVTMDDGLAPNFGGSTTGIERDFNLRFSNQDVTPDTVEKINSSLYRVSVSRNTLGVTNPQYFGVSKRATNSPRTFKVTGYQLEVGSFPTSYIRTLNAPVIRSADSMTRTLGQEWNPNEYTIVGEFKHSGTSTPSTYGRGCLLFRLGTDGVSSFNNQVTLGLYRATTTSPVYFTFSYRDVNGSGFDLASYSAIIPTDLFTVNKFAISVKTNEGFVVSFNGQTSITISQPNLPVIHHNFINLSTAYDGSRFTGTKKNFKIYPRAFDALTLQRLSRIQ